MVRHGGGPGGTDLEAAVSDFADLRPRLFGIAYRMLGSVADAEDLVQETWVRWQNADRAAVANPAAYLTTTITRLAITTMTSARKRRETTAGPWLPEPVDTSADPQLGAETAAALDYAVLVLLEKLTPTERAAYVLREAFDYPYPQVAEIVRTSEVAARQLVSRARKRLAAEQRRPSSTADRRRLLRAFMAAAKAGDLAELEKLFAEDVISYADGGGVVRAARVPIRGAGKVSKSIRAWDDAFWDGAEAQVEQLNGQEAVVLRRAGTALGVILVSTSDGSIDHLYWMLNPDKLAGLRRSEAAG